MGLKSIFKFLICKAIQISFIFLLTAIFLVLIPHWPPYASISESYGLPPIRPLTGKLAINNKLDDVEIWHKGDLHGPECILDYNGDLYTGLLGGDVVKLVGKDHIIPVVKFGKPCGEYYEEKLCGRPLGMQFDKDGFLYVADAYYGLWKADLKSGKKELLVSPDEKIDGKLPKIFNSIALSSNGDIYFTISSSQFELHDGAYDMIADPSGRLIRFNPKTKIKTVLIDNLAFANGVVLSYDEDFILVAETMKNRILRYYLKGPKKGTYDIFVDALPGLTDNLSKDGKGGYIAPLVLAVDEDHPLLNQMLAPFPLMRRFLARFLGSFEWLFETVDRYYPNEFTKKIVFSIGHFTSLPSFLNGKRVTVIRLNKDGDIIDSLHSMNKKISHICDAHIFEDTIYFGSFRNDYIVKVPLSKIGWNDLRTDNREKREAKPVETPKTKEQAPQKKQAPTEAPKVQTTTPSPPKKEPQVQKENVQSQKQTPPPKPAQQHTQPPKQPEAQKQTPPPKREAPPKETTPPVKKETVTPKPTQQQTQPPKQPEVQKQTPSSKAQTQTQTAKQETKPKTEQPAPKQQPPAAAPKQQPPAAAPKQQPPAAAPKQQPPAAVPKQQPPAATPKQQPPAATPKQQPPAAAPRQQPPAAVPQQAPKQAAPAAAAKQAAPAAAPKQAVPAAAPKQAPAASPQKVVTKPQETESTNKKVDSKPQATTQQKAQATLQKESGALPKQAPPSKQAPPVAKPVKEQVNKVPLNDGSKK